MRLEGLFGAYRQREYLQKEVKYLNMAELFRYMHGKKMAGVSFKDLGEMKSRSLGPERKDSTTFPSEVVPLTAGKAVRKSISKGFITGVISTPFETDHGLT